MGINPIPSFTPENELIPRNAQVEELRLGNLHHTSYTPRQRKWHKNKLGENCLICHTRSILIGIHVPVAYNVCFANSPLWPHERTPDLYLNDSSFQHFNATTLLNLDLVYNDMIKVTGTAFALLRELKSLLICVQNIRDLIPVSENITELTLSSTITTTYLKQFAKFNPSLKVFQMTFFITPTITQVSLESLSSSVSSQKERLFSAWCPESHLNSIQFQFNSIQFNSIQFNIFFHNSTLQ